MRFVALHVPLILGVKVLHINVCMYISAQIALEHGMRYT